MNLTFLVHENYLISQILSSDRHTNALMRDLQNSAWEFSSTQYHLVTGRNRPSDLDDVTVYERVPDFFQHIKRTDAFQQLLRETHDFKEKCEKEWEELYPRTSVAMQEMTGLDLEKDMRIFIVHPDLKEGRYLDNDEIVWGHHDEWSHYTPVYLWHEILHSYFGYDDPDHALIQLIADNELRTILNGGSYPPFEGHPNLFPLMEQALPQWKQYLDTSPQERDLQKLRDHLRMLA